jgi:poly(hydroxyalkanoate) granule-associated protein
MNPILQKAMYAGIGLALVAKEKAEKMIEELVEKGKHYQETKEEEKTSVEAEATTEQAEAQTEETTEHKTSLIEEYEQKLRKLIDSAITRFNFIRNDDHERIEKRIEVLEEKLTTLAQEASTKTEASSTERI